MRDVCEGPSAADPEETYEVTGSYPLAILQHPCTV